MNKFFKIWRPEIGETIEDAESFGNQFWDVEIVVQNYAEYYHNERDGWEARWPIEFHVADKDNKFIGRFSVEREMEPTFRATKID